MPANPLHPHSSGGDLRCQPRRSVMVMLLLVAVAIVAVPAAAQSEEEQTMPPALVRVGQVDEQMLQRRWPVVGRLREVRRVIVSAEQEGRIVEVNAEEGSAVIGGETVLARIEAVWAELAQATAQAQLEQAQASVLEAEARLDQASRDLEYLEDLQRAGSAKPKEVTDARADKRVREAELESAQAAVLEARAQVDLSQTQLDKLEVVAPFDGVVVAKMIDIGRYVTRGSPVAEIVSRGAIDAIIDVPEKLVNELARDETVDVRIEAMGATVQGQIVAIIPDASAAARTFPVKVRLSDEEGRFKPGMSVRAQLPTGQREAVLTVPRDAVLFSRAGAKVWTVSGDSALPIDVEVLFGEGGRYAVRTSREHRGAPLEAGMPVIVEGAERLMFPGHPVQLMEAGASPQAAPEEGTETPPQAQAPGQ